MTEPQESPTYPSAMALTASAFPGPVFHYTNQAGFLGIVRDKAVWATDLRYLNDSREYLVGFDRIANELGARTAGHEDLETIVRSALGPLTIENAIGLSVASFSLAEDDLSQWRAYGSGSGGICIGFDSAVLAQRILLTGSNLGAVRYTRQEHSDIVDELCTEIVADAKLVLSGATPAHAFSTRCSLSVQLASALMKHHTFADEREWRMVVWSELPPYVTPGVRPGRSTLTPHLIVRLDHAFNSDWKLEAGAKLPLDTIWIGPTPHPSLAIRGGKAALKVAGESAEFKVSEVPFRNW